MRRLTGLGVGATTFMAVAPTSQAVAPAVNVQPSGGSYSYVPLAPAAPAAPAPAPYSYSAAPPGAETGSPLEQQVPAEQAEQHSQAIMPSATSPEQTATHIDTSQATTFYDQEPPPPREEKKSKSAIVWIGLGALVLGGGYLVYRAQKKKRRKNRGRRRRSR